VPKNLQGPVYDTWNAWRRNLVNVDAMRAWEHAADAAIQAVK